MDVSRFVSLAALQIPDRALVKDACVGHVPFACWLIEALRPSCVVELGKTPSSLFLVACHAGPQYDASCRCLAADIDATASEESANLPSDGIEGNPAEVGQRGRLGLVEALASFPSRSIDLLLVPDATCLRAMSYDLSAWLERMSPRGVLLVSERGSGFGAVLSVLRRRYRTLTFLDDGGLLAVQVGNDVPLSVSMLFDAAGDREIMAALRAWYHRLGQGLKDRLDRLDLEQSHQTFHRDLAALSQAIRDQSLIREENATLLEESRIAEERLAELTEETEKLQKENRTLRADLGRTEHARNNLFEEVNRYQRSLGWALMERSRKVRAVLVRNDRRTGRYVHALERLMRLTVQSGPKAAMRKAASKLARKLGVARPKRSGQTNRPLAHLATWKHAQGTFEELNWTYTGSRPWVRPSRLSRYPVILVSHSACRTGAPLCLLRLAKELSDLPELEVWIVLKRGGELRQEFEKIAPTLDAGQLVDQGGQEQDVADMVAALFREYASRGIVICNTMAVSTFHEAFARWDVPVLSWIHELPTMVNLFGGAAAVGRIKTASRRLIVPADAVRDAWIAQFDVEPDRIRRLRYGLDARTANLDRAAHRARVRAELGIPDDAYLVLGCGTVDLRKGADLFAQISRYVLSNATDLDVAARTWFVWVGECPYFAFQDWLLHDAAVEGRKGRLLFTGQQEDTVPYYLAADLFALTSREDPCPFANLEAMESGLPIVAFKDSGGAPEVIGASGITVPYLDVRAMAGAVVELLRDASRRERMGSLAQTIIRTDFTWARFLEGLTEILHADYGLLPPREMKVSVIVPNYRHAAYLEERLESIFRQTVPPHEIIVLDDASPDESFQVIERIAATAPLPLRVAVNEANSGSPFRQWVKGIEMASGDLIWIAESDDSCYPEFLERLLPEFFDPDVVIAYCQSELIGDDGRQLEPHFLAHTDDLSKSRWRSRYCVSASEEAEIALSQKNTIPNASAMIFRKPERLDFLHELFRLRFAGDWLSHALLARNGKVSYIPDVLNRYRRHQHTVTHHAVREDTYFTETLCVKSRIFTEFMVSAGAIARSMAQSIYEFQRLAQGEGSSIHELLENPMVNAALGTIRRLLHERAGVGSPVRLLLLVDNLAAGVESLSAIHLANALAESQLVFLWIARPELSDPSLTAMLSERLLFIEGTSGVPEWPLPGPRGRRAVASTLRETILLDLAALHAINVVDSRGRNTDRLAREISDRLGITFFAGVEADHERAKDSAGLGPTLDHEAQRGEGASQDTHAAASRPARRTWSLHGFDPSALSRDLPQSPRPGGEFRIYVTTSGNPLGTASWEARTLRRIFHRLPRSAWCGKRITFVASEQGLSWGPRVIRGGGKDHSVPEQPSGDLLTRMAQCDVAVFLESFSPGQRALVAAALALGIPVIAAEHPELDRLIVDGGLEGGVLLQRNARGRLDLDRVAGAILRYLSEPDLLAAQQSAARGISRRSLAIQSIARQASEAYQRVCGR